MAIPLTPSPRTKRTIYLTQQQHLPPQPQPRSPPQRPKGGSNSGSHHHGLNHFLRTDSSDLLPKLSPKMRRSLMPLLTSDSTHEPGGSMAGSEADLNVYLGGIEDDEDMLGLGALALAAAACPAPRTPNTQVLRLISRSLMEQGLGDMWASQQRQLHKMGGGAAAAGDE